MGVGRAVVAQPGFEHQWIDDLQAIADVGANRPSVRFLRSAGYARIEASRVGSGIVRILRDAILPVEVRVHRSQIVTEVEDVPLGALVAEILLEADDGERTLAV